MKPLPLALVFAAALAACGTGDGQSTDGAAFEVIDTLGYPLMVNRGQPASLPIEVDFRVGRTASGEQAPPDEFGRITSVAVGPDGNIWVADALAYSIKVFAPDGSFLREFGRDGEGPGEFGSLYSLAFVGDTLLALDFGNGRIAELSLDGEWLGQRSAPGRISGSPAHLRFHSIDSSTVAQWSLDVVDGRMERAWVGHGPEGVIDTWPQVEFEPPETLSVVCERNDGGITFFSSPFSPAFIQAPSGIGTQWVGWSARYRIYETSESGDTLRVIARTRAPVPISDAEWDEGTREFQDFRDEWAGRSSCEPRNLSRAENKAAFRSLLRSTSGDLWVEVHTSDGTAWEIFDAQGRLEGTVPGFSYDDRVAPYIRDRRVVWVEQDELGVQRVLSGVVR